MKIRYIVLFGGFLLLFWSWWGDVGAGQVGTLFTKELSDEQIARLGQWGDAFGAFNALASAAGFAVVLGTLLVQSRAIKGQAADLHRQRFESAFFELLRLMRELRAEVSFRHTDEFRDRFKTEPKTEYKGHDAITHCVFEMIFWIFKRSDKKDVVSRDQIVSLYQKYVHKSSEKTLGPYFRLIYTLMSRVKSDKILTDKEKYSYGNLLRSQLTSHELVLLGINGLSPISKDLDNLIIEFRLLKYLPSSAMRKRLESLSPPATFQARD